MLVTLLHVFSKHFYPIKVHIVRIVSFLNFGHAQNWKERYILEKKNIFFLSVWYDNIHILLWSIFCLSYLVSVLFQQFKWHNWFLCIIIVLLLTWFAPALLGYIHHQGAYSRVHVGRSVPVVVKCLEVFFLMVI